MGAGKHTRANGGGERYTSVFTRSCTPRLSPFLHHLSCTMYAATHPFPPLFPGPYAQIRASHKNARAFRHAPTRGGLLFFLLSVSLFLFFLVSCLVSPSCLFFFTVFLVFFIFFLPCACTSSLLSSPCLVLSLSLSVCVSLLFVPPPLSPLSWCVLPPIFFRN